MAILEFHQGCNAMTEGCMGPWDNYYTLFGTPLEFLKWHLAISVLIAAVFSIIMVYAWKKKYFSFEFIIFKYIVMSAAILMMVLIFLLLAYIFPVRVVF
jgi:hypothetical protein